MHAIASARWAGPATASIFAVFTAMACSEEDPPPDDRAPTAVIQATPTSGDAPLEVVFDGSSSSDPNGVIEAWSWTFGDGTHGSGKTTRHRYLEPGEFEAALTVVDDEGERGTATQTIVVTSPENQGPSAVILATPSFGEAPLDVVLDGSGSIDPDGVIVDHHWTIQPATTATGAVVHHRFEQAGTFEVVLVVFDEHGVTDRATTAITVTSSGLPPDPETVAPPLDPMVPTRMSEGIRFLYTGTPPIQTGVDPADIDPERAAALRGRVLDPRGDPVPGVIVQVLGHSELGATKSRADGHFDLAVNGGGALTVRLRSAAHLEVQRTLLVPAGEFTRMPDVVLLEKDPRGTAVDLGAPGFTVARGSPSTDTAGTRQATLLFRPGTTAQLVLPDGSRRSVQSLTVRATEYTVGASGPAAMPAELPPTSGYTYAVELGADEVEAAGADGVALDPPAVFYVEDFIGFEAGGAVPAGFYDRQRGVWVAAPNGRVIDVVDISGGTAELDTDGDGLADDAATLAALAITTEERAEIASLYPAGQRLWRVPVAHFTPWDLNWPYGPPEDAREPDNDEPETEDPEEADCEDEGSIIRCRSQVLGERIPIAGTPLSLVYMSDRVEGDVAQRTLRVQLTGADLPASLQRVHLDVWIAGQRHHVDHPPQTNLVETVTWDGRDVWGRATNGPQPVTVRVGYEYPAVYYPADPVDNALFGRLRDPTLGLNVASQRTAYIIWRYWRGKLGALRIAPEGLGGFTLDVHHLYDAETKLLLRGDGGRESARAISRAVRAFAGSGETGFDGDHSNAVQAKLFNPWGLDVAPDGSLYFVDASNHIVRRVGRDGSIERVAGTGGRAGWFGDGHRAIEAQLSSPLDVAVAPDGSFYIADRLNRRIRRVGPEMVASRWPVIQTVVGGGSSWEDGVPALQADLLWARAIAIGPDGSLYIADQHRVRRVGNDGIIDTIAGTGAFGYDPPGAAGVETRLFEVGDITFGPEGRLYIADTKNHVIRRLNPDGRIDDVAGRHVAGYGGDGLPARAASLREPGGIAFGPDGSLYIADTGNHAVRRVLPNGIMTTFAGAGAPGYAGDGGSIKQARFDRPQRIVVAPNGAVLVSDTYNHRVRLLSPGLPEATARTRVAGRGAEEIFVFDERGRHLRTEHGLTGGVRWSFDYDAFGRITLVTDAGGQTTLVERDGQGRPTGIVSPDGLRTTLTVDGTSGYLRTVTDPAGIGVSFRYRQGGLLDRMTDRGGHEHHFGYDAQGRLTEDRDPAGGTKTLTRTAEEDGFEVTLRTGLGTEVRYAVATTDTGARRFATTHPSGGVTTAVVEPDGDRVATSPDGARTQIEDGAHAVHGMAAALIGRQLLTTPGGRRFDLRRENTATLVDPYDVTTVTTMTDTSRLNTRTFTQTYDVAERTRTRTTPEGRQSTVRLDAAGRTVSTRTGGRLAVTYGYDDRGRLSSVQQGSGATARTFRLAYGTQGWVSSEQDPEGRVTAWAYDAAGRPTQVTLPGARVVSLGVDAQGNLTSLAPPGRAAHHFAYTAVDQVREVRAPGASGPVVRYGYDIDRRLTSVTRADGRVTTRAYGSDGRLTRVSTPDGDHVLTYDAADGRLASISSPDGQALSWTYDGPLVLAETWTGPVAGQVSVVFDDDLAVVSRAVNGAAVAYGHDDDGLLDAAGGLTILRDPASGAITGTQLGALATTCTESGFGEIAGCTLRHGATVLYRSQYERDRLGRITRKVEAVEGGSETFDYVYDAPGRLITVRKDGAVHESFEYDSNGNCTRQTGPTGLRTASYDGEDRLLSAGGRTYEHGPDGERLSATEASATTTYGYDVFGALRRVQRPGGPVLTYLHDPLGRRVGAALDGVRTEGWLYRGDLDVIATVDPAGAVTARFVYGTQAHVPDSMLAGGRTYRIVTDQVGSVRLVVDAATGIIAQRIDYSAFGEVLSDTQPGLQPFGFAGGLYDPRTGLVRFGAREYDPITGRFTSKDPLGVGPIRTNLYTYADGDPINRIDLSGLESGWQRFLQNAVPNRSWFPHGVDSPITEVNHIFTSILAPVWIGPVAMGCFLVEGVTGDMFVQSLDHMIVKPIQRIPPIRIVPAPK